MQVGFKGGVRTRKCVWSSALKEYVTTCILHVSCAILEFPDLAISTDYSIYSNGFYNAQESTRQLAA